VLAIVTAHGGAVHVTSPGDTAFVVTLPGSAAAAGRPNSARTVQLADG